MSDNYKIKVELAHQAAEELATIVPPSFGLNGMQIVAYHAHFMCFGASEFRRWQGGIDVLAQAGLLAEMEEFTPR